MESLLPSPESWCTESFVVPSKSLFPQSCGSSIIKFCWPSKSNSWGFSVPLWDPRVGQSVTGPRTLATVEELLWYSCSPICESPARQLYSGVNGDLLQEGLCHRLCDPGSCTQSPCPCGRPILTHTSTGDTQIQFWQFEKSGEYQKNIYFCFIDYTKAFNCVDHNKLWKILQEMGISDHLSGSNS